MIANISSFDKVSIVAIANEILKETDTTTISDLAKKLNVSLSTENRNRNRKIVIEKLRSDPDILKTKSVTLMLKLAKTMIMALMTRCLAVSENQCRRSYAPWFKELIVKQLETYSIDNVSYLTTLSPETLKTFKGHPTTELIKQPVSDEHTFLMDAWNQANFYQKKNLHNFWMYLGRKFPDRQLSYESVRQMLIDLGLRYPRGPKIKDHGAQVKTRFEPHTLWEGDGKYMKIHVNGIAYHYCWYCFIDQNSTLIVGSSIGETESANTFLSALKAGKDHTGFYAMGILIDNRLGKNVSVDLSSVNAFCVEHGISLIHTFPGNAKSNGTIEGNFSIFEKYVGEIHITGDFAAEVARSVAAVICEIFTQQRNHSPRKRTGGKTPVEDTNNATRPEHMRGAVERLKNRFEQEAANIEEKWQLVKDLLTYFGPLLPASIDKLETELGQYPVIDIIAAKASYLAQLKRHPEKRYGPEYLLAIVRNKREEQSKQIYNEVFRAGIELARQLLPSPYIPDFILIPKLVELVKSLVNLPSPSHKMLQLESLAWWMVDYNENGSLSDLWRLLEKAVSSCHDISLKSWSFVAEFLVHRIGPLIYGKPDHINRCDKQAAC